MLASDDQHRAGECVVGGRVATESQKLANGQRLADAHGVVEDFRIEGAWCEEVGLDAGWIADRQISVWVVGSEGGVRFDIDEIAGEFEERDVRSVLGKAGECNAVADTGVFCSQGVGVCASVRVAHVEDLFVLGHAFDLPLPEGN